MIRYWFAPDKTATCWKDKPHLTSSVHWAGTPLDKRDFVDAIAFGLYEPYEIVTMNSSEYDALIETCNQQARLIEELRARLSE